MRENNHFYVLFFRLETIFRFLEREGRGRSFSDTSIATSDTSDTCAVRQGAGEPIGFFRGRGESLHFIRNLWFLLDDFDRYFAFWEIAIPPRRLAGAREIVLRHKYCHVGYNPGT